MKALAFATLLLLPFAVSAQQDSIATGAKQVTVDTIRNKHGKVVRIITTTHTGDKAKAISADSVMRMAEHQRSITIGSGGIHLDEPVNADTIRYSGDTIHLNTRNRSIRIIIGPRTVINTEESFEDRLADLRRQRRNTFTYWAGLELGINTFITPDGRIGDGPQSGPLQLNNSKSRFFAINFMEQKVEFGSHHVGLLTGLGVEFLNYKLSSNSTLAFNGDSTWAVPMETPELRKNKLRQIGLRVPLMLEFNTKSAKLPANVQELKARSDWSFSRKDNFHLAAGIVGSWYFDTMYKQKWTAGGHSEKQRDKGDYNLLPYRLAARAQIGFGSLNLFAEYALTPIFEEGTAPDLRALNVGLTLMGFN